MRWEERIKGNSKTNLTSPSNSQLENGWRIVEIEMAVEVYGRRPMHHALDVILRLICQLMLSRPQNGVAEKLWFRQQTHPMTCSIRRTRKTERRLPAFWVSIEASSFCSRRIRSLNAHFLYNAITKKLQNSTSYLFYLFAAALTRRVIATNHNAFVNAHNASSSSSHSRSSRQ